jgi:hypothetical protein
MIPSVIVIIIIFFFIIIIMITIFSLCWYLLLESLEDAVLVQVLEHQRKGKHHHLQRSQQKHHHHHHHHHLQEQTPRRRFRVGTLVYHNESLGVLAAARGMCTLVYSTGSLRSWNTRAKENTTTCDDQHKVQPAHALVYTCIPHRVTCCMRIQRCVWRAVSSGKCAE